ncbi:MAG: hypothetical protein ACKVQB_09025 [Bacteroidia bacterium]
MKNWLLLIFLFSFLKVWSQVKPKKQIPITDIKIEWADSLPGDFGFVNKWSYADNIFKNEKGQLVCDNICPAETERMMDNSGNIFKDSLKKYYKLIDTSHYFHTIQSDAWCYEYGEANFITCFKNSGGFINCYTMGNAGTHCSLRFSINGDKCSPLIHLNSVAKGGTTIFKCNGGSIVIDKDLLAKGFLKAEFNFNFINTTDSSKPIYWKGKIYCEVNEM